MSSGERPIGAAKGKQSDTEALYQTPPTPQWKAPLPQVVCDNHGLRLFVMREMGGQGSISTLGVPVNG